MDGLRTDNYPDGWSEAAFSDYWDEEDEEEMAEPDWSEVKEHMLSMTLKELAPIKREWFNGCLGGVSGKAAQVNEMIIQMSHWWHIEENERVMAVLKELGYE